MRNNWAMSALAKRSDLVASLATVTIAALGGPLGAVGVATARELVKYVQSAWDKNSPQRHLQERIQASIGAWAKGEQIDAQIVDRGLGWAIEYVQAAGPAYQVLADTDLDLVAATGAVIAEAKQRDRYWGTEAEHAVAERALRVTYAALCSNLKADNGVTLAAIQSARQAILASISDLRDAVSGVADRDDLIRYLNAKVDPEWDLSPWTHGRNPSQLERTLQLVTDNDGARVTAADALTGTDLLVVLGGPGSGKTWLAQRFAREAAAVALAELRDPRIDPGSVELPLFTRWAQWAGQEAQGIDGLVAAALPGESAIRLRRWAQRPGARVLAVVDSLDEVGVGEYTAKRLLRALPGPAGWRAVVTSRPEAWHTFKERDHPGRVGRLVELSYPDDVTGFVEQWFDEQPAVARRLLEQIGDRPELRATAIVPLLLTFYCMLTEQHPTQNLPWRRRDLYRSIIDRLLRERWNNQQPAPIDLTQCHQTLQTWAWDAVRHANTPTGLGAWPDAIETDLPNDDALARALDNVAPQQQYPAHSLHDHTRVERRFLHRTLLEYAVAEHLSTIPVEETTTLVLPHVWFDPDWEATLPMVIAAHPERAELIDNLFHYHEQPAGPAQQVINDRLEVLLLQAAAQTLPQDWPEHHHDQIDAFRKSHAQSHPELIAATTHWPTANATIRTTIITTLTTTNPWLVRDLVKAFTALDPTDDERAQGRTAILTTTTNPGLVRRLVEAFTALDPTDNERAQALTTLTTTTNPEMVRDLVAALPALDPTDDERAQARTAILTTLTTTNPWRVRDLVEDLRLLTAASELLTLLPLES